MAEGESTNSGKSASRPYGIFSEANITAEMLTDEAREELHKKLGVEAPYQALVRVGGAVQANPKAALTTLGETRDLNGEYDVIADSAVTKLPAKTATKRTVSIG